MQAGGNAPLSTSVPLCSRCNSSSYAAASLASTWDRDSSARLGHQCRRNPRGVRFRVEPSTGLQVKTLGRIDLPATFPSSLPCSACHPVLYFCSLVLIPFYLPNIYFFSPEWVVRFKVFSSRLNTVERRIRQWKREFVLQQV